MNRKAMNHIILFISLKLNMPKHIPWINKMFLLLFPSNSPSLLKLNTEYAFELANEI